ncbi:MAG: hypothetical protein E6L04_10710 [Thaumarchaeota archaeon]|nr:MAG: hypothetical protein E6L04_10710 [Nitrososphaerota archaeon]TLX92675.1 MAG: hypothetical protein E6K97_00895 [Nitrososphaerota archaeon]
MCLYFSRWKRQFQSLNYRIQKFQLLNPCPITTIQVAVGVCYVTAWGSHGYGNGQFSNNMSVAFDSLGRFYVADEGNNRIQVFYWREPFVNPVHPDIGIR